MVSRKPCKLLKMNLGNQKKNKQMKFYHIFLHLIQITHLYITQLRIPLKSLREITFKDLKASNLLTVSGKHVNLRNYSLKLNLAMKK